MNAIDFILDLDASRIPERARHHATRALIDTLGCGSSSNTD